MDKAARQSSESERQGSLPENKALFTTQQGWSNPGATPNLRGVEGNTALVKGTDSNVTEGSRDEGSKVGSYESPHFQTWPLDQIARGSNTARY